MSGKRSGRLSIDGDTGFTLVEMLVVLGLVALLLVISLPYSTSSGELRKLDAAVDSAMLKTRVWLQASAITASLTI